MNRQLSLNCNADGYTQDTPISNIFSWTRRDLKTFLQLFNRFVIDHKIGSNNKSSISLLFCNYTIGIKMNLFKGIQPIYKEKLNSDFFFGLLCTSPYNRSKRGHLDEVGFEVFHQRMFWCLKPNNWYWYFNFGWGLQYHFVQPFILRGLICKLIQLFEMISLQQRSICYPRSYSF